MEEERKQTNAFYKIECEKSKSYSKEEGQDLLYELMRTSKGKADDYELHKRMLSKLKEEDRQDEIKLKKNNHFKKIKKESPKPKIALQSIFWSKR